jgi:hypothetical protein
MINIDCVKAKRKARWLRYVIATMMLALVAANIALGWLGAGSHAVRGIALNLSVTDDLLQHPTLALIDSVLVSLIFLAGLYRLVRLMRLFEQGEFFSARAVRHLRVFALSLLLGTLASCLLPAVELVIARLLTAHEPAPMTISFNVDSSDVWMAMIGALFFTIAWIMEEAGQLAEDNQLIV